MTDAIVHAIAHATNCEIDGYFFTAARSYYRAGRLARVAGNEELYLWCASEGDRCNQVAST